MPGSVGHGSLHEQAVSVYDCAWEEGEFEVVGFAVGHRVQGRRESGLVNVMRFSVVGLGLLGVYLLSMVCGEICTG